MVNVTYKMIYFGYSNPGDILMFYWKNAEYERIYNFWCEAFPHSSDSSDWATAQIRTWDYHNNGSKGHRVYQEVKFNGNHSIVFYIYMSTVSW